MPKSSAACPYCHGASAYLLSSADVNRKTSAEIFDFYQCADCDMVFLDPKPEDMIPYYKGGYQQLAKSLSELKTIARKERYRMDPILKYKKRGRLLEIGPWMGVFSCNAKDAGFEVTAIEMSSECVEFMNHVLGIEAIQSSDPAATMDSMEKKFDVIALWHSLEHLHNPWLVLRKAAEQLAPGGILLIAVPNIESYDFSVLKESWVHLDAPRHLVLYTAPALERVCAANGLETLELTTSDRLSHILSQNAWCDRAASKIPVRYLRRIVGWLLYQVARRKSGGNGSGLTAIFKKPV